MKKQRIQKPQIHELDALLAPWQAAHLCVPPGLGWARSIREALGWSTSVLGRKLGMSHAGVRKLEAAEAAGVITLASLYKLAQALECDLRYALVPRTTLALQRQREMQAVVMNWLLRRDGLPQDWE